MFRESKTKHFFKFQVAFDEKDWTDSVSYLLIAWLFVLVLIWIFSLQLSPNPDRNWIPSCAPKAGFAWKLTMTTGVPVQILGSWVADGSWIFKVNPRLDWAGDARGGSCLKISNPAPLNRNDGHAEGCKDLLCVLWDIHGISGIQNDQEGSGFWDLLSGNISGCSPLLRAARSVCYDGSIMAVDISKSAQQMFCQDQMLTGEQWLGFQFILDQAGWYCTDAFPRSCFFQHLVTFCVKWSPQIFGQIMWDLGSARAHGGSAMPRGQYKRTVY